MVLYQEAQKKAQAEIDRVVGTDRLPNYQDQDSLPYGESIEMETSRSSVRPLRVTWRWRLQRISHPESFRCAAFEIVSVRMLTSSFPRNDRHPQHLVSPALSEILLFFQCSSQANDLQPR